MHNAQKTLIRLNNGKSYELWGRIARKYDEEIKKFNSEVCPHTTTETRSKKLKNGNLQAKPQCLLCGMSTGTAVKNPSGFPPWDESLETKYWKEREARKERIAYECLQLQEEANRIQETESANWKQQYAAYRRTPEWQKKRAKVFERANGICEGCMESPALVVHHTTYTHVGDELIFQLVALCRSCHDKAHPEHSQSFYDNDFVPCLQCRYGNDGIYCGKFDVPAFQALGSHDMCGPNYSGLEGLK